jgi:hypothetical protein
MTTKGKEENLTAPCRETPPGTRMSLSFRNASQEELRNSLDTEECLQAFLIVSKK